MFCLNKFSLGGGHLARMRIYEPSRIALHFLQHKGRQYLISLQDEFGQQCHGKRFHVWRYEKMFYQHFGDDWQTLALDNEVWNDKFINLLNWRKGVYNRQRVRRNEHKCSFISFIEGLVREDETSRTSSSSDSSNSSSSSGENPLQG